MPLDIIKGDGCYRKKKNIYIDIKVPLSVCVIPFWRFERARVKAN